MTEREGQHKPDSPLVSERGSTTLSDSVVSKLAGLAAGEVEGVYMGGSASRNAGGLLESVTGSQSQTRGVSVEVGRTEAAIDLTLGIEYGRNIMELVGRVRGRITEQVQNLTGLRVTELNVTVSDIVFPNEENAGEDDRDPGGGQGRRRLESEAGQGDRPQARRTEDLRAAGRERGASDTTTAEIGPGERGRAGGEGRPGDEDETRELRFRDEGIDETRRIPREDQPGRGSERDR
ncbi:MAG: Asp23/Gls24 family envelope stress response protein [Rubrobacter sp.]